MNPIGASICVLYNDPHYLAVSNQIDKVKTHVIEFDKIKKNTTNKKTLDPTPFYELVAKIKKTINGVAFGHMASGIGIVQDLILNNAHKFNEQDKKKLMQEETHLGEARLSRAGNIMPRRIYKDTILSSHKTEQNPEFIASPATAILLSGIALPSLDGQDPFEKRSSEERADDQFFNSIALDGVKSTSHSDSDEEQGFDVIDEEEDGLCELEEWEREILQDYDDTDDI